MNALSDANPTQNMYEQVPTFQAKDITSVCAVEDRRMRHTLQMPWEGYHAQHETDKRKRREYFVWGEVVGSHCNGSWRKSGRGVFGWWGEDQRLRWKKHERTNI